MAVPDMYGDLLEGGESMGRRVVKKRAAGLTNKWAMRLWPVAPLLVLVQLEFDVRLDVALSMLVGHVRACRMNMSADGWPYYGVVVANSRTQIRDLADFAWPLGLRADVLPLVAEPTARFVKKKLEGWP
jgi:hypothetical protein